MAKPVFRYYIDFDGTGAFATEVTSVLMSAQWQLGFSQPFDLMARDNTAELVVQNSTRNFSPEYASGAYYGNVLPGRAVKITSTYASVTRTMWLGWIASYQPSVNIKGDRTCTISCTGWFERAQRRESLIPIQLGQTADTVIGVILDESDILPPGISGRWILGVSTLGQSTYLGAITDYFDALDTGDTTFAFAGDWSANTSVYGAIREMVEREGARFWQARGGSLTFAPRQWFPTRTTSLATFADNMMAMDYVYGADVSNIVITNYAPRTTGSSGSTLATLASGTLAPAASFVDIEYRFVAAGVGETVGATALITPVTTTDFTANSQPDGSGSDLTANISAAIVATNATAATVRYTNSGAAAYIQAASKLRGTPLTKFNALAYTASDADSLLAYGRLAYTSPGVQDSLADATTLGDYQLSLRKDPVGRVDSVVWSGWDTAHTTDMLTLTVGDRITMSEQQTQANGAWFIIGESHSVSAGSYNVTWVLEDAGTIIYWLLGTATQSELGQTTFVGPL